MGVDPHSPGTPVPHRRAAGERPRVRALARGGGSGRRHDRRDQLHPDRRLPGAGGPAHRPPARRHRPAGLELLDGLDIGVPRDRFLLVDDDGYPDLVAAHACEPEADASVTPETQLLLLFTSGTTGASKAARCSQGGSPSWAATTAPSTTSSARTSATARCRCSTATR
ncbi:hypothetical protein ACFQY7_28900 [Actinomadura luteofluorescens]|uniref:hypothetical protein n=1 Tax=Actinomadura luteofluorescens TaxID=46163 RepID=UPI003627A624